MTGFTSDRATAKLTSVEEGVLRGLGSLGYDVSVADLCDFAAGFANVSFVAPTEARAVLLLLDSLGWARAAGEPLYSDSWSVTGQGRVALDSATTSTSVAK